jgi:uncharacterized protein
MKNPSLPYVLPFAVFLALLSLESRIPISPAFEYPMRVVILSAVLYFFSRPVIDLRVTSWLGSCALGIAVFAIWIAPETLFPGWRTHWLFNNAITGAGSAAAPDYAGMSWPVLLFRFLRAVCLVPIIEELFWRAWLMRWIISPEFWKIRLGTYTPASFWITAALFASEHGRHWDVGLIGGVLYNWWMVRTKSLGDCILSHAVTNALLSTYVITTRNWDYW